MNFVLTLNSGEIFTNHFLKINLEDLFYSIRSVFIRFDRNSICFTVIPFNY